MTTIQSKKNIQESPKLRFKGFCEKWTNEKLGNLFFERMERAGNKKYDLLSITLRDGIKKKESSNKADNSSEDKSNYKLVHVGDIAYNTMRMWQGASGVSDLKGIVSPAYTVVKLKDGCVDFYKYLFKKPRTIFDFYRYSQGLTSDTWNLKYKHFSEIIVNVPQRKEEQRKIAEFLGKVDEWVNNLKEQKEKLEEHKKGLMQNIFSQEIRFKNDDGKDFPEWEEKKLKEIGSIKTSSVNKKINPNEKKVKLLNYMDVYKHDHIYNNNEFQNITAKDSQIKINNLKKGDVLFTPSSETPTDIGHSAVIMEDLSNVLFSYHLLRLRPKKNILFPLFSGYTFENHDFYKELWELAQGATRFTLSLDAIKEVHIFIPKSLKEQRKIAEFLTSIDDLIEQKEKQISKVETWKKGLIEKMFI